MRPSFYIALIVSLLLPPSIAWAKEYNLDLLWQTPIGGETCRALNENERLRKCDSGKGLQLLHGVIRGNSLSFWGWNLQENAFDNILIDDLIKNGFEGYKTIELQENYGDLTLDMFDKHEGRPLILDVTSDNQNKI